MVTVPFLRINLFITFQRKELGKVSKKTPDVVLPQEKVTKVKTPWSKDYDTSVTEMKVPWFLTSTFTDDIRVSVVTNKT